jgi:carbonic anhydrase
MKRLFLTGLLLACTAASATLCESGKRQSPIDILATSRQTLAPLEFDYHPVALKMANDGHTLRVRFDKGSSLRIGKERFALQQFHFHTPGGDKIGGEEFPMAAHLLHKSPSGQLLAVVVLFRVGPRLLPLHRLVDRRALHRGRGLDRAEAATDTLAGATGAMAPALCRQYALGAAAAPTRRA